MSEVTAKRRRSGGRQGRRAVRAAPPAASDRAVVPGLLGGDYRPLREAEIQRIHRAALDTLEKIGMAGAIPSCVALVEAVGGHTTDQGRLCLPSGLVEGVLAKAAKSFLLPAFDPAFDLEISGTRVHLGTGGAAVNMLDSHSGRYRDSSLVDLYDLGRLIDTLDNIHWYFRPVVARDLVDPRELDLNTAYACMMATRKPIGCSFFVPEAVTEAIAMFDLALGGEGAYAKRPFCHASNAFVVPPLRFAVESCLCLEAQVRAGMPVLLISAGQAGATSPAALAGSLVQGLAECLAGLVFVNLLRPGHPAIVGLWPFVSDLRTGAMSGGGGEGALLNGAAAQILNWYGLPSGVPAGMADSKLPDNQAGYEKGTTVALAAAAGANMVYESAGMLGSILGASLEALVIDNDMLGAILRTVRGVEVSEETLSLDVIAEVVAGDGHYLGHEQTLARMERDYVYPTVGDRLSPKDWTEQGETEIRERAHRIVRQTLTSHHPDHVERAADLKIRERLPIRLPREEIDGTSGRWT